MAKKQASKANLPSTSKRIPVDPSVIRKAAILVFRFGEAVVLFRHSVEKCLIVEDPHSERTGVLKRRWQVDRNLGLLQESNVLIHAALPGVIGNQLEVVVSEAAKIRMELVEVIGRAYSPNRVMQLRHNSPLPLEVVTSAV